MEYEIVNLEEKIAVGLSARTSNASPDMGAVIGGLWNQFYNGGVYASIQGKANQKALGIYTEYEGDEKAQYTVLVACEVAEGRETGDFEEYQDDSMENAEIHIYVGLKEE